MSTLVSKINKLNWQKITEDLHKKGYSVVENLLPTSQCKTMINLYDGIDGFRKTVNMERYRFGFGEYKYFDYPLPKTVEILREHLYPYLSPIANEWMKHLNIDTQFPKTLDGLRDICHSHDQLKPTPLILRYQKHGYNTLHQDLYGDVFFPIQAAIFLNQVNVDYTGGEFVITEQVPRAQSRATVLSPNRGDMVILTTNFRPVEGKRGYYRVSMKHGVSEVHEGTRHTLGIIFHDALS